MFTIDIDGKPIQFRFTHNAFMKTTHCALIDKSLTTDTHLEIIQKGVAHCHAKDNFCKSTGRKISLARAIRHFDKPTRTRIWQAYLAKLAGLNAPIIGR